MRTGIVLALALAFGPGIALAKTSECMTDCERQYKACATSGKMSERMCRGEYEKCRRNCEKKGEKTGGQAGGKAV